MDFFKIFKRFDIRLSIELWILFSVIYYWLYIYLIKFTADYCKIEPSYCIEFLPYGDFLAVYVAIVGLYFVVTSLDDWKHQDKFQTAKINLVKLHEINSILLKFKNSISNFDDHYVEYLKNSLSDNDIKETNQFKKYKAIKCKLKIQEKIEECELDIKEKNINLFQNNFESCIILAKVYIQELDEEIIKINNEKRVHINNRITKYEKDKKIEEARINNMPDGIQKQMALINLGASRLPHLQDTTIYYEINKLDINTQDLKPIIKSKNNSYIEFSNSLEEIQKKLNNY